ncbi:response regulator transcription factor [Thiorhodococcus mannitoliphagus]|uniref:Response regulator transcription factor n=1 Tax=Thiorhodococcus mannitoliphagus TaxID=329406 RepID=A0A6P1DL51_9GAMM|nr:response regulator transcription factor [Thiorhodococcus mannitoliphagus]NEX18957.1 response regulator transcription factor [Thiorhodococcus mannitoliphagus]
MTLRILLADDHRILREGLAAILGAEPDLEVVGQAADGFEVVAGIRELAPDVLILDLSMPRMDGLTVLQKIKHIAPDTRTLVMTFHKTEAHIFQALAEGADGYMLKDSSTAELLLAVRSVGAGARHLCSAVASQLVDSFVAGERPANPTTKADGLSAREREVLKLVAEGFTSKAIGELLCISEKTVEKHRANMTRKLGVSGVPALTAYAIANGLLAET